MELINRILGLGAPRRYFGGNSGYVGYSKSKRAVAAENRGLRSKSQMDRDFLNEVNDLIVANGGNPVTLAQIKRNLQNIARDEWHHTSMYGNKTDYYSAKSIASYFCPAIVDAEYREFQNRLAQKRMKDAEKERISYLIRSRLGWSFNGTTARFLTPYDNVFIEVKFDVLEPLNVHPVFVKERWSNAQNAIVRTFPSRDNNRFIAEFPAALPIFDAISAEVERAKSNIN